MFTREAILVFLTGQEEIEKMAQDISKISKVSLVLKKFSHPVFFYFVSHIVSYRAQNVQDQIYVFTPYTLLLIQKVRWIFLLLCQRVRGKL